MKEIHKDQQFEPEHGDGLHSEEKSVRDERGHFIKGNKASVGNSGRPPEKNKKAYLEIMRETLTPEKWRKIVEMAINDAIGEDAWARDKGRTFFSKYVLPQKLEVEWSGEFPVQVIGVEGFQGWGAVPNVESVTQTNGDSEA